jgi:hypothetical protein
LEHQILCQTGLRPVSGHQCPVDSHQIARPMPGISKHCRQFLYGTCWLVSHIPSRHVLRSASYASKPTAMQGILKGQK